MGTAAFAPVGIDTEAPRKSLSEQDSTHAAPVGTGISPLGAAHSMWIRLESFVLLLTALMTLLLMGLIATRF